MNSIMSFNSYYWPWKNLLVYKIVRGNLCRGDIYLVDILINRMQVPEMHYMYLYKQMSHTFMYVLHLKCNMEINIDIVMVFT